MPVEELPPYTTLRDKTLKLLHDRPRHLTLDQIARDTGLSQHWLSQFARNRVENPGVNFVQNLYQYLTKSQLTV